MHDSVLGVPGVGADGLDDQVAVIHGHGGLAGHVVHIGCCEALGSDSGILGYIVSLLQGLLHDLIRSLAVDGGDVTEVADDLPDDVVVAAGVVGAPVVLEVLVGHEEHGVAVHAVGGVASEGVGDTSVNNVIRSRVANHGAIVGGIVVRIAVHHLIEGLAVLGVRLDLHQRVLAEVQSGALDLGAVRIVAGHITVFVLGRTPELVRDGTVLQEHSGQGALVLHQEGGLQGVLVAGDPDAFHAQNHAHAGGDGGLHAQDVALAVQPQPVGLADLLVDDPVVEVSGSGGSAVVGRHGVSGGGVLVHMVHHVGHDGLIADIDAGLVISRAGGAADGHGLFRGLADDLELVGVEVVSGVGDGSSVGGCRGIIGNGAHALGGHCHLVVARGIDGARIGELERLTVSRRLIVTVGVLHLNLHIPHTSGGNVRHGRLSGSLGGQAGHGQRINGGQAGPVEHDNLLSIGIILSLQVGLGGRALGTGAPGVQQENVADIVVVEVLVAGQHGVGMSSIAAVIGTHLDGQGGLVHRVAVGVQGGGGLGLHLAQVGVDVDDIPVGVGVAVSLDGVVVNHGLAALSTHEIIGGVQGVQGAGADDLALGVGVGALHGAAIQELVGDVDVLALVQLLHHGALVHGGVEGVNGVNGDLDGGLTVCVTPMDRGAAVFVAQGYEVLLDDAEGGPQQILSVGIPKGLVSTSGLIVTEDGVLHGGNLKALEHDLGNDLTGGGASQTGLGDVVGDAIAAAIAGSLQPPVVAGELLGVVEADGPQDHHQGLIAGNGGVGVELAAAHTQHQAVVGAVVHVAVVPPVGGDVGEVVRALVQLGVLVVHVAGDDAVQDGRNLGAGDGLAGPEAAIIALDNLQGGQDVNRFLVGGGDLVAIGEVGGRGGVDGDHEAQGHHHRQDQREKLL